MRKTTPLAIRFLKKVKQGPDCWEFKGAIGTHGYGRIGDKNKTHQAHRVSFELFKHKLISKEWVVMHTCDNRSCVNPKHLVVGLRQDNINDCIKKKRHVFGVRSNLTKLSEKKILKIRDLYKTGKYTQTKLGKMFKTHQSNIHNIVFNKTRKNG